MLSQMIYNIFKNFKSDHKKMTVFGQNDSKKKTFERFIILREYGGIYARPELQCLASIEELTKNKKFVYCPDDLLNFRTKELSVINRNKHNIKSRILSESINDITRKIINGPLSTTKIFKFHQKKK